MSAIESAAYFAGRARQIGITEPTVQELINRGWDSSAAFAYATSYQPGQVDDQAFVQGVLVAILGANWAASGDAPRLRRLYFESHTMAIADLRRKVEATDEDRPIQLPIEERSARLTALKTRLVGLEMTSALQPSHKLTDIFVMIQEKGQLRYVSWSECTSREQEVLGEKKSHLHGNLEIKMVDGYLKQCESASKLKASTTNELLIMQALTRRDLAMDLAGLISFQTIHKLTLKLVNEMQRTPIEGYNKVTVDQIERADRRAFLHLAELTSNGLARNARGDLPLEISLPAVMVDVEFNYLLMQLPIRGGKGSGKGNKRKNDGVDAEDSDSHAAKRRNKGGKGKGKKKKDSPVKAGKETVFNIEGKQLCFGYQRGKCPKQNEKECDRGLHLCWFKGCGQEHAGKDHK